MFVAVCLCSIELAAPSPVYMQKGLHAGPFSFPVFLQLKQCSWLRSLMKAFPSGPQFACALGANTHTHTPCSRPLIFANLTNQPSEGWERGTGSLECVTEASERAETRTSSSNM
ncbi:hypothetical protein ILYODFUR_021506 [Ilyodon furcidens]|uniref:Secreted protein n=1 Tax=Ilyodon furcidens TaxID=33524 RepID=A0ABV0UJI4_9TELE